MIGVKKKGFGELLKFGWGLLAKFLAPHQKKKKKKGFLRGIFLEILKSQKKSPPIFFFPLNFLKLATNGFLFFFKKN